MRMCRWMLAFAAGAGLGWTAHAQSAPNGPVLPPAPATKADVGPWDAKIVRRASQLIASPAQWNRNDSTGECRADATTLSLMCALDRAIEEAAGIHEGQTPLPAGEVGSAIRSQCVFHTAGAVQEGTCGTLFDEVPIFMIAHARAVATGVWRKDMQPTEVWAGTMSDAESPVLYEARQVVNAVAKKKYAARLIDYNNDSTTTFADLQAFFTMLEDRVIKNGAADLDDSTDPVEIEMYASGAGVIRTYRGWFPVTNFAMQGASPRFQIDLKDEVPPNDVDRQIIQRAAAFITSDAVWNRADNRKCPAGATTWSIYCAEEQATIEVTGGFHHRRPALELVRVIVEERSKAKNYNHRLMDYNNDPATTLADVKSLFADALRGIRDKGFK
jgi:hypothetical protein